MAIEWTPLSLLAGLVSSLGLVAFVVGGLRFRRWVVADRIGIPRYPGHVETIMLWLIYSSLVSFVIVVVKQTLRHV